MNEETETHEIPEEQKPIAKKKGGIFGDPAVTFGEEK